MQTFLGRVVKHNSPARVSKKIAHLRHEGIKQDQAVAMAHNMDRKHRLTESGGYIRAKKKGKR